MADQESVPSNIYTVLVIVAFIALLAGVVFVAMRSKALFDSYNPLDAEPLAVLMPAVQTLMG